MHNHIPLFLQKSLLELREAVLKKLYLSFICFKINTQLGKSHILTTLGASPHQKWSLYTRKTRKAFSNNPHRHFDKYEFIEKLVPDIWYIVLCLEEVCVCGVALLSTLNWKNVDDHEHNFKMDNHVFRFNRLLHKFIQQPWPDGICGCSDRIYNWMLFPISNLNTLKLQ